MGYIQLFPIRNSRIFHPTARKNRNSRHEYESSAEELKHIPLCKQHFPEYLTWDWQLFREQGEKKKNQKSVEYCSKSPRWMHNKDRDTAKQNQPYVGLGHLHNAVTTHTLGTHRQQLGMCCGGILDWLEIGVQGYVYRRWKRHKREEKEHRLQTNINAKVTLLVKGWGGSFVFCYL